MARMICDHAKECSYIDCVSIRPHRAHKDGCSALICAFIDKPVVCIPVEKGGEGYERKRIKQVEEPVEDSF
jgi:hypothetical protein